MLEIIVITIILIAVFIAAAWYARYRSIQRAKLLSLDDDDSDDDLALDEDEPENSFSSVFEYELEQQTNEQSNGNDDSVTLSDAARDNQTKETTTQTVSPSAEANTEAKPAGKASEVMQPHDWDMVVSFTIMAFENAQFSGKAIKTALESHDLHFGDMQIYHRYTPNMQKQTIFSVANILDPGTLIPDDFATMNTPGLLIFARLPGPVNGLALFDELLDVAQKMTAKLGGVLCDEKRQPISDAVLEEMRSRIFNLNVTIQQQDNQHQNDYSD